MNQELTDYVQRKDWTLEDHLDHNALTVNAFILKFGDECYRHRVLSWKYRQYNPSGHKPSIEDFIADLTESLAS